MFYLWVGVMIGSLFSYLWGKANKPSIKPVWRSPRWWLAAIAVLILCGPIVWDCVHVAFGNGGPSEAVKSIVLPSAAGFGFGVWIYLTLLPLPRETAAGAAAFLPIIVSIMFVFATISEEKYGWFTRLQKISLGGGGLEFSPNTISSGQYSEQPTDNSLAEIVNSSSPGDAPITQMTAFMKDSTTLIDFDKKYIIQMRGEAKLSQSEKEKIDDEYRNDRKFFDKVVVPLGEKMADIHKVRGFNSINSVVTADFPGQFRAFVQNQEAQYLTQSGAQPQVKITISGSNPERGTLSVIAERIDKIWENTCNIEKNLIAIGSLDDDGDRMGKCTRQKDESKTYLEGLKSSPDKLVINPNLPYATVLSSLLLSTTGEQIAAIKDINVWALRRMPRTLGSQKFVDIFRAYIYSAQIAVANSDSRLGRYNAIMETKKALEIGDQILSHPGWRSDLKKFEKPDLTNIIWTFHACANDLEAPFKRLMSAQLSLMNNFSYFLSQEPGFSKINNLKEEMKIRADYLGSTNFACLATDATKNASLTKGQANYLDTIAAVYLSLSYDEEQASEKKLLICNAKKKSENSVALYNQLIQKIRDDRNFDNDSPRSDIIKHWDTSYEYLQQMNALAGYMRRSNIINRRLSELAISCDR